MSILLEGRCRSCDAVWAAAAGRVRGAAERSRRAGLPRLPRPRPQAAMREAAGLQDSRLISMDAKV